MTRSDERASRQRLARQGEVERNDQALLDAGRRVLARDGVHASVGAIAEAAGVGVGTLYRRYASKTALFERLLVLSNAQWADAVSRAQAEPDPWLGLSTLIVESVEYGQGTLSPLARLVRVPAELTGVMAKADAEFHALIDRTRADGGLAPHVTATDVMLLIEQYARSPLIDQIAALDDADLLADAKAARRRLIAIALNGMRRSGRDALPAPAPSPALLTARWVTRGERSEPDRRTG